MSTLYRTACTECGWTGNPRGYRSRALADYAYRQHSCEKARRDRAAYERGQARASAVDRTPKPCLHKIANHEHGTYACYVLDACRCLPCSIARSGYDAARRRRHAYGRTGMVDAEPVREHVRALGEAGVGLKTLSRRSGVSRGALTKLVYGTPRADGTRRPPARRVRETTARRILAVTAEDRAGGALVDPTGPRRRVEALIALGWSVNRLATEHGIDRQALDNALNSVPITRRNADAIRDMYEAVGDRRPEARNSGERRGITRALRRAAEHGWVVPAMWDDDQLDDPTATPPAPVAEVRRGVDLDEWAHLVRNGEHPRRAAKRCGVTLDAVEQAIRRHDRADLRDLLTPGRWAA
jgi:lambda repressor-like predicted transcriptional regulator